jgi:hypothetical protein
MSQYPSRQHPTQPQHAQTRSQRPDTQHPTPNAAIENQKSKIENPQVRLIPWEQIVPNPNQPRQVMGVVGGGVEVGAA